MKGRIVLLALLAGIALAAFQPASAEPRRAVIPEMTCKTFGWDGSEVECHSKHTWPFIPYWTAYQGATQVVPKPLSLCLWARFKLPEGAEWTVIEMQFTDDAPTHHSLRVMARRGKGKAEFKRYAEPPPQVAEQ